MAAGLLGALLIVVVLLFNVQYAAFGYQEGTLQQGVEHASHLRRIASLLIVGGFGGVAWFPLRPLHPRRAVGDRRGAVERRGAAVVPPLPGHLGDLRGRHRDGRLDRPGSRPQVSVPHLGI